MKKYETITTEKEVIVSVQCDVCKKEYNIQDRDDNDIFEVQEFTHIKLNCGYGSVFGDGDVMEADICQHCLKERLGDVLRLNEKESY